MLVSKNGYFDLTFSNQLINKLGIQITSKSRFKAHRLVIYAKLRKKQNKHIDISGHIVRHDSILRCQCCNPEHVQLGTDHDNQRDVIEYKLSSNGINMVEAAKEIRRAYLNNEINCYNFNGLDNKLGVAPIMCQLILRNKRYRDPNYEYHSHKFSSMYRGIFYEPKSNGYIAQFQTDGKHKYIGIYTSDRDAAIAYDVELIKNRLHIPKSVKPTSRFTLNCQMFPELYAEVIDEL